MKKMIIYVKEKVVVFKARNFVTKLSRYKSTALRAYFCMAHEDKFEDIFHKKETSLISRYKA